MHLLQVEKRVSLSWRGQGCFQWSVQGLRTGVCVSVCLRGTQHSRPCVRFRK